MTYLDWTIVSVIAGCMFLFALRGFVRQAMGFLILTAAILGAWAYRELTGALLQDYVEPEWLREALGFVGVFFAIMLSGSVLTWVFVRLRSSLGLGAIDRLLGMALGGATGFLLAWGVLLLLQQPLGGYSWWRESKTAPLVLDLGARLRERVDFATLWERVREFAPREAEQLPEALQTLQQQLRPGAEAEQGTE